MFEVAFAAYNGIAFGAFVLLMFALGIVASERDSFFLGTVTIIAGLVGLDLLFAVPVWDSIKANPMMGLIYVIAYVVIGSLYTGMWRWPDYIKSHAGSIKISFGDWSIIQRKHGGDTDHESFLNSSSYHYSARKNKQRLAAWVLMWPFSLTWALSHRPAMWLFEQVYAILGEVFENVSKRTARKILNKNV